MTIYAIIPSRKDTKSSTLDILEEYFMEEDCKSIVIYDAPSIYEAFNAGLRAFEGKLDDDDVIVLCHDDIEILSSPDEFYNWMQYCLKPGVGFIGVAGAARLGHDGVWWNSRLTGEARGFVFQGKSQITMTPNYFGKTGQVVCLDGCFMAASYKTIKKLGFEKPHYISENWDFYDIHTTFNAHLQGFNNYTVPILIRHESDGQMREGWFSAKANFLKYHNANIPCKLNLEKTNGIPN